MADAIRLVSIMRGYDPRDFALVAFGGAGSLHGVALARDLSIPTVIVPPNPGVTSALGCLLVDIQHDLTAVHIVDTAKADPETIEAAFKELESEAHQRLEHEGVAPSDRVMQRSIDMRYGGQWRALSISVPAPITSVAGAIEDFEQAHLREYNYKRDGAALEIFRLNVTAIGLSPKAELQHFEPTAIEVNPVTNRAVVFDDVAQSLTTPIYNRDSLHTGFSIEGPCIIEQLDATTLIPPQATVSVDAWLNLIISV